MKKFFILFIICSIIQPAYGQFPLVQKSEKETFLVEKVAGGLGIPWGMAFLNSSEIIFTQRDGKIRLLFPATGEVKTIKGAPSVKATGQGGLLDVAVPPGHKKENWIYFTYSKDQKGQGVTTLARAKLDNDVLMNWQDILVTRSATDTNRHYGSRIAFDNNGSLWLTARKSIHLNLFN